MGERDNLRSRGSKFFFFGEIEDFGECSRRFKWWDGGWKEAQGPRIIEIPAVRRYLLYGRIVQEQGWYRSPPP